METPTDDLPAWNSAKDSAQQVSPIDWINRSHESVEEWKRRAKEVFYSVNGESNVARNRVAAIARDYFLSLSPQPEAVQRWKKGCNEIETIMMQPPKVPASNAAYFDWVHIADFLLLACAAPDDESSENQTRDSEYRAVLESFRIRNIVFHARKALAANPKSSDDELIESLKSTHPTVALAHIKEARKLQKAGLPNSEPMEPSPPSHVPLFVPIYFRGK